MRRAIVPGSFDPVTNGHLAVIKQATALFDEVVVAVMNNPDKHPMFSVDERAQLIRASVAGLAGVTVESFSGLLVDYAKQTSAVAIVRGLRGVRDFESESDMAHMNRVLYPSTVTVFIPTFPEFAHVSSSLVKDIARHGGAIEAFVPAPVEQAVRAICNKHIVR